MPDVEITALAETSPQARARMVDICLAAGRPKPAEYEAYEAMLENEAGHLDAVYVSTPHVLHGANALAVVEAGLDLLLEKPMVVHGRRSAGAARGGDADRAHHRRRLPGMPLAAHPRHPRASPRGEFGELVSVSASIWENWAERYAGQWKQNPAISGGGFMFDTGAHMMNTVCLLADAEFERLSAFANNRGRSVDVICAVAARLANGSLVTFNAAGDGPPGCASAISLFYTKAIVRIDAWGAWREVSIGEVPPVREVSEITDTPMHTFQAVREGRMANPFDRVQWSSVCPPVGRDQGVGSQ